MPFKPGESGNTQGRKKGSANKVTADIRNMLHEALNKAGGVGYLVKQSEENPTSFNALIAKVIPKEVAVKVDVVTAINTEINFGD